MMIKNLLKKSLVGVAALLATTGGAYAAEAAPAIAATIDESAFRDSLSPAQRDVFENLSASDKSKVITAFSDPRVTLQSVSDSEADSLYPGMTVDDEQDSELAAEPSRPRVSQAAAATTYNVHSWYKHKMCYIGICNTATLDYYYVTGSNKVLSSTKCTWKDTGIAILVAVTNISTNHWVSGGQGHCDATVQLADSTRAIFTGWLEQDMVTNGPGIVSKYFHQEGP
jgi:hypothetical protein